MIEEVVPLADGRELVVERPHDVEALIDAEAFETRDEFLPYWAELWPSGVALARAVARAALRGKRVLELGCGLGLPSLAAALGGARVLATDWAPAALDLLERNAARNGVAMRTALVDWRDAALLERQAPWDLVLGADLLYEARNVAPLLDLLPRLGPRAWIADPGRATAEPFWTAAPPGVRRIGA